MSEKDNLTKYRLEQNHNLVELEKKWGRYCYVPLDIPKFENQEIVDWFFKKCAPSKKIKADIAASDYNDTLFNAVDVFVQEPLGGDYHIWEINPQQDFFQLFPEFFKTIQKEFPFEFIGRIIFWSSINDVPPHRDQLEFLDFPHSFRIILHDENPNQTLSLIEHLPDTPDDFTNEFSIPKLEETNSFAWNNLRVKHTSKFIPGHRKIIILLIGQVNKDRYNNLMERSVQKFDQYAFKSNLTLDNWVKI